jgi:uncharacterized protein with HEPN domain
MLRIQEYLEDMDFINFRKDYKTVDAVVRNFEIIGEAGESAQSDHLILQT